MGVRGLAVGIESPVPRVVGRDCDGFVGWSYQILGLERIPERE